MKSLKWFLCWLLVSPLLANGQWMVQDPGFPELYEIKHVQAISPDLVWVCAQDNSGEGQPPYYSFTQDGGATWNAGLITDQSGLVPGHLFAFSSFPFAFTVLYKSDENGEGQAGVYATFDNGETWNRQPGAFEHPEAFPDIVYFWNTSQGIAIGDPVDGEFDIYLTSDLGTNWNKLPGAAIPDPLPGENAIVRVFSVVGNTIWFSTTKGRVYKSENNGLNWSVSSSAFNAHTRVVFTSPQQGYLQDVGSWETTGLAETNDGGSTWETVNFSGDLLNWDLKYIPGTISTLLSSGAYLRLGLTMSLDGGDNWNSVIENYKIVQMDWFDWQTGWVGCILDINPDSWKSFLLKYNGPGMGDFMVSPLEMDFGDIFIGQSSAVGIVFTNLGTEPVEVISIESLTDEFTVAQSSFVVEPNSQYVVSINFSPSGEGYFDGQLNITCNHPELPEWNVILHGRGVTPSEFVFEPDSFDETLLSGEQVVRNFSFTNNNDNAFTWEIETDYLAPLQALGWQYGSTPLNGDDGILDTSPDQAMFIKDVHIRNSFSEAMLRLGFDDGIRVWVNGTLVLDDKFAAHEVNYWDQELNITQYLDQGINRITAVVFNGVFEGGGGGGFDCELEVDGQFLIKRGDENYGDPEAMWFYFGETAQQLIPPDDIHGKKWWEKEYGRYQWLSVNQAGSSVTGNQFAMLGWNPMPSPIGGDGIILSNGPDNAFFIKDVEIDNPGDNATLYLAFDDGCQVYINGSLAFDFWDGDHGAEYWNEILDATGWFIEGRNRISIVVYNGMYGGCCAGYLDVLLDVGDQMIIGPGVWFPNEPISSWLVFGQTGQILEPGQDNAGRPWYDFDYALGGGNTLAGLGWILNSTPVLDGFPSLGNAPDNAQFIKDIYVGEFESATLSLSFDDGCRVWINGNLEFDFAYEVHRTNYWDQEVDVSWLLQQGTNRIAVEVYNGIYGGGGPGGFDCQLLVDEIPVIMRGDENQGAPEAMWFMYGRTGDVNTPPDDANNMKWYQLEYAMSASPPSHYLQGNLDAWQTGEALVVLDATGLTPGEYNGLLRFRNAGTGQVWEIPVNLYVDGSPVIAFEPETLDYGDFYIGFPESQLLKVINKGSDLLEFFEISTLDGVISVAISQQTIEPGQSAIIDVTIDPYLTGEFTSALVFNTNDPKNFSAFVPVKAQVLNAPDIELPNLEYLFAILEPGESEIQDFSIYNVGEIPSDLEFTIPQALNEKQLQAEKKIPDVAYGKNYNRHNVTQDQSHSSLPVPSQTKSNYLMKILPPRNGNEIMIFSDDMESGASGWLVENYIETEPQWHLVSFNSSSPDHAWWCGNELTGTYWNGNRVAEAIISPKILLPPYGNTVYMTFAEFYELEGDYDVRNVDISTDGGENWQRIFEQSGALSETWLTIGLDISEFAGNEIMVKFLFDTWDEVANLFAGWFVDDVRIYSPGFPFISVEPGSGSVFSGEYQNMLVTYDATGYEPGLYPGFFLIVSNDPDEHYYYLPANLLVEIQSDVHNIDLPQGWSGLSSYRLPYEPAIEIVFAPIAGELIIAQTMDAVYYPGENINTIGLWEEQSAYKVKTLAPCTLSVFGNPEDNLMLGLDAGWSLIPVIASCPVNVVDLFQPAGENLTIVKDVANIGVYWPAMSINTIGELLPGKAYYVLMSSYGEVEFPYCGKNLTGSGKTLTGFHPAHAGLSGLGITNTPSTHTIAILPQALVGFEQGTLIGAFDQAGNCFGATDFNSETIILTVFGDDPTTAEKDGFFEGEMIFFKNLTGLEPTFDPSLPQSDGLFTENGLTAITGFEAASGIGIEGFGATIRIYPNPTIGLVNISGLEGNTEITIRDAVGQLVLQESRLSKQMITIDLGGHKPGVYFAGLKHDGKMIYRKVVLR